jgi:glycolate oxidase FAD binding subunit
MVDAQQISHTLAGSIGEAFIKTDPVALAQYAVDHIEPQAVIFPPNTQAVSEVVKYANQKNLALVPWGAGSKMSMGNPPQRLDLVVCTSRMNHMTDVDTANLTLTVEAGVKFKDIQARLATEEDRCYLPLEDLTTEAGEFICSDREHKGSFLPIDPPFSDRATIGGIIASNSSGPRRLLYTNPRDIIIGVRFVSPTGNIVGMGGKTVKNVSGYDIPKLMVGSIGSLGILCDMTLRLLPLPEKMETLVLSFDTFAGVTRFTDRILAAQLLPAAVEVMNRQAFLHLEPNTRPDFKTGAYVVAIALEAYDEAVARMNKEVQVMASECDATDWQRLKEDQHGRFWLKVSNLALSESDRFTCVITAKLSYPISEWKGIWESVESILASDHIEHSLLAHAGTGVCQVNLFLGHDDRVKIDRAIEDLNRILSRCREAGGNLMIQSAPVDLKKHLRMWGQEGSDLVAIKRVKARLDPSGIMSPGRFVGGI